MHPTHHRAVIACATLKGDCPEMSKLADAIVTFMADTAGDISHEDATSAAEAINIAADDFRLSCELQDREMASGDPYDAKCDEARDNA